MDPTQPQRPRNTFRIVFGLYLAVALFAWYFLASEDPPTTSWWKHNLVNPGVRAGKALIWPYSLFRQSTAERHLSNFKAYTFAAVAIIQDKLAGRTKDVDWDSCTRFLQIASDEGKQIPIGYLQKIDEGENVQAMIPIIDRLVGMQQSHDPAQREQVIAILSQVRGQP